MRNALFVSWFGNGKKMFLSVDDIKISFQVLVDCHERERERESRKGSASTRVSEAGIKPNMWSKMNVSNAEKAFEHKTLAEIATHLYSILHVKMKDQLCGNQFKVSEKNKRKIVLGYWSAVGEHLHKLMTESWESLIEVTKSAIVSFEWMAHVHEMFNNILMNTQHIVFDRRTYEFSKSNSSKVWTTLTRCVVDNFSVEKKNWITGT